MDPEAVALANSQAFSTRDVDAMMALYAGDATVVDRRRSGLGSFAGHDELRAYYASIFGSVSELRETLTILAAAGERVVAHCSLWGRLLGDTTGSGITVEYGLVIDIADGTIRHLEIAEDGDHALELAGLG
jgi:hypothetical protein